MDRDKRLQLIPMESSPKASAKIAKVESPYVVHLKRKGNVELVSCDVYIGRAMNMGGWRLPLSKWANPFKLSQYGHDRDRVIIAYEEYIRSTPRLMSDIPELAGKSLGCWCAPDKCHGDVLIKIFNEILLSK